MDAYAAALDVAHRRTLDWLVSLDQRQVPPRASIKEVTRALGTDLPERSCPPEEAFRLLVDACEPGLTAMPSGRFFGFVIGGTQPAALAADWLFSAWTRTAGCAP